MQSSICDLRPISSPFDLGSALFDLRPKIRLRSSVLDFRSSIFDQRTWILDLRSSLFALLSSVLALRTSLSPRDAHLKIQRTLLPPQRDFPPTSSLADAHNGGGGDEYVEVTMTNVMMTSTRPPSGEVKFRREMRRGLTMSRDLFDREAGLERGPGLVSDLL